MADYFLVDDVDPHLSEQLTVPNYNVAPTDPVPVVVERHDVRLLTSARWGFVPFWDKSGKPNAKMINARSETIATMNAFKRAIRHSRCLIPADGFYEWRRRPDKTKQPYFITPGDGSLFAFAGISSTMRDDGGQPLGRSCSILTGPPITALQGLHDRMPLSVRPAMWDAWLSPDVDRLDDLAGVLEPAEIDLDLVPVSSAVNKVANNGPELVKPTSLDQRS